MEQRNEIIDVLKGIGIILMIMGHLKLPFHLITLIFIFHMPMFFMISGYLFKDRCIKETIARRVIPILKAYVFTGLIIWIAKIFQGHAEWGISLVFGNGSRPVLGIDMLKSYSVGPLWYLLAYCFAVCLIHYVLKLKCMFYRFFVSLSLFELSIVLVHFTGLLPFDIYPSLAAVLFILIGFYYKNETTSFTIKKKIVVHIIGCTMVAICFYRGSLSMASHIYRLNLLQIIAAMYMTYLLMIIVNVMACFFAKNIVLKKLWGGKIDRHLFTSDNVFSCCRL